MKRTKADQIIACFEGPSGAWGICRSLQWYKVDVGVLALHDHLRRLTRAGLLERCEVYHVKNGCRRKEPVWSLTRAGQARQRQLWDESRAEREREREAANARWWAYSWDRVARHPVPDLAGWWLVSEGGMLFLANPDLREFTSSWKGSTFPPGIPDFITAQARRMSDRPAVSAAVSAALAARVKA